MLVPADLRSEEEPTPNAAMFRDPKRKDDAESHKEAVAASLHQGRWTEGIPHLEALMVLEPGEAEWVMKAAECYGKIGSSARELELLLHGVDVYAFQGLALKAIGLCKVAARLAPEDSEPKRRLEQLLAPARAKTLPRAPKPLAVAPLVGERKRPDAATAVQTAMREARVARHNAIGQVKLARLSEGRPPERPPSALRDDEREKVVHAKTESFPRPPLASLRLSLRVPAEVRRSVPPSTGTVYSLSLSQLPAAETASSPEFSIPKLAVPVIGGDETDAGAQQIPGAYYPVPEYNESFAGTFARSALERTPLFGELPRASLRELLREIELTELEPGELVFRQGDPADAMYVIVEGRLEVTARALPSQPAVLLATLGDGDFFGEIGLLSDQARQASVRAMGRCRLLRIDRRLVHDLLAQEPAFVRVLLRFIKQRLVDDVMVTSPLFSSLPEEERLRLREEFEFLEIEPETLLVEAGAVSDGLFVWLAGEAQATTKDGVVRSFSPGTIFGELSRSSGEPAAADVRTRSKGFALWFSAANVRRLLTSHPELVERLQSKEPGELGAPRAPSIELPEWGQHVTFF